MVPQTSDAVGSAGQFWLLDCAYFAGVVTVGMGMTDEAFVSSTADLDPKPARCQRPGLPNRPLRLSQSRNRARQDHLRAYRQ